MASISSGAMITSIAASTSTGRSSPPAMPRCSVVRNSAAAGDDAIVIAGQLRFLDSK
jgi:hypothetical protein